MFLTQIVLLWGRGTSYVVFTDKFCFCLKQTQDGLPNLLKHCLTVCFAFCLWLSVHKIMVNSCALGTMWRLRTLSLGSQDTSTLL